MHPSDESLMERCRAGEAEAFGILYTRYQSAILRFVERFLSDRSVAEDLCQETFVRALRGAEGFDSRYSFRSWLYRIATNLCLNEIRHQQALKVTSLNEVVTLPLTDREFEEVELHELIPDTSLPPLEQIVERRALERLAEEALAALSQDHRRVVTLRFYEGLQLNEIAERLGLSPGTVKSRLHYALRRLREKLGSEWGFDEEVL